MLTLSTLFALLLPALPTPADGAQITTPDAGLRYPGIEALFRKFDAEAR